jgi:hypothetical protein
MPKSYYASDILSTSSKSSSTPSTLTQFTEGTITGAIIGTVAGVLYGKFNDKNVYFTGFIGMVIGGVVSKIITM